MPCISVMYMQLCMAVLTLLHISIESRPSENMEKLALNPLWKVFGTRSRRQIAVTVEGSVGLDASTL